MHHLFTELLQNRSLIKINACYNIHTIFKYIKCYELIIDMREKKMIL